MTSKKLLAAVVGCLLAFASPVWAQEDDGLSEAKRQQALELHKKGVALIGEGKHAQACAALSAAWGIYPNWRTAGALGTCAYELKHHAKAATHLAAFLRDAPDEPKVKKQRDEAARMLGESKRQVSTIRVVVKRDQEMLVGAEVLLDGNPIGKTPITHASFLDVGTHVVVARYDGKEVQLEHTAVAGTEEELLLAFKLESSSTVPVDDSPYATVLGVGFAVAGASLLTGGILLGVGAAKTGDADGERDSLQGIPPCSLPQNAAACSDILSLREDADAFSNAGLWLLVGGGALAAGTAIYAIVAAPEDEPQTSIVPVFGPTEFGVMMRTSF